MVSATTSNVSKLADDTKVYRDVSQDDASTLLQISLYYGQIHGK